MYEYIYVCNCVNVCGCVGGMCEMCIHVCACVCVNYVCIGMYYLLYVNVSICVFNYICRRVDKCVS